MILQVQRLNTIAKLPTYGGAEAAGMDLYSVCGATLAPGQRALIKTGIAIAVPKGHYARVAPRSGLAFKNGIDVLAGVIDSDYRGEVGAILINHSDVDFVVNPGDRVAQLIIEKIEQPKVVEAFSLDESVRGADGFGSTGVAA